MNIQEFFELFFGQWVSQRTLHHIRTEQTDVNRADLWIEAAADSSVAEACAKFGLPIDQALCPMEITHKATLADGRSQIATTVLVPVKNSEHAGQLISVPQSGDPALGAFELGSDDVMTFSNSRGADKFIERIWYASENLRIRSITQVNEHGASEANFCSEIRRMGATSPKPTEEQSQQPTGLAAWRARQGNLN